MSTTPSVAPSHEHTLEQAQDAPAPLSVARRALREAVLVLAGTAAIALLGQLRVPLPFSPVPVTLGTFAALGAGTLLGPRRGTASALLLALLAALGAPVLAGLASGVTPTFGYVLGYALAAGTAGAAASRPRAWQRVALMLLASALVYVPGLAWLSVSTGMPLASAAAVGALPFVVGDVLKSLAAAGLSVLRRD